MRGKKGKITLPIDKPKRGRKPAVPAELRTHFGDGTVVSLFDKSPAPQKGDDIFCPHFWELKYANGCAYDCQWCYLNGTYRFLEHGKTPTMKQIDKIVAHLEEALTTLPPTVFNAGEVSDALVFEGALINKIVPLFHKHKDRGHKLLLLTKSASLRTMASCRYAKDSVIFAYSLNADLVSRRWEILAPTMRERINAAREASMMGYEVRLRIDPIVPVEHYESGYRELVKEIMEKVPGASIITLGSLRGLSSTIITGRKLRKDMSWTMLLREKSNWGDRIPFNVRVDAYKVIINELNKLGYKGSIGLCKETLDVFKELKLNPFRQLCNCKYNSPLTEIGERAAEKDWEKLCSKDATPAANESSVKA